MRVRGQLFYLTENSMRIQDIAIGYIDIPLVTAFQTALRRVESVHDLIVRVTAEDGSVGYGEAPPTAVITGDTTESIEAAVRGYLAPALTGLELDDGAPEAAAARMDSVLAKNSSAKAAVDIAVCDLCAKLQNKPLFELLQGGGTPKRRLETDITISVDETGKMAEDSLRAAAQGFRILKVKVGKGGAKDVERIREIRRAVGPEMELRVDANQGWTVDEAVATIRAMEDENLEIALVEQPVSCHDFDGLKKVTGAVDTPILADESVFSYEDAKRLLTEHAADLINIKLMKTGGIYQAARICELAKKYDTKCMMGCMLESKVSVSAAAHLAAAEDCIVMADLDGPSLCSMDPYEGGPLFEGPDILLTDEPGIGIRSVPVKFESVAHKKN